MFYRLIDGHIYYVEYEETFNQIEKIVKYFIFLPIFGRNPTYRPLFVYDYKPTDQPRDGHESS